MPDIPLTRQINISESAARDFDKIIQETISGFGDIAADKLIARFGEFINIIGSHPYLFGYYLRSKNIRKFLLSKNHLVLYSPRKKEIQILAIVYSRQNPTSIRKRLK